jgi:hypothetical protein
VELDFDNQFEIKEEELERKDVVMIDEEVCLTE